MELDKEEVLNELMNFEKNYGRDFESGLPDCLERFLVNIAKSGDTIYPWNKIKPVILKKIELVINDFNTKYPYDNNPVLPNVKPFNFQEMKDEIIEKFDYFYGAPFTIQRICELLTAPSTYYKRSDKFMRGLEKNIRVITTIEARRSDIENEPSSFQREYTHSPKNNNSSSPSSSISSSPSSSASSSIVLCSPLPSSSTSSSSAPSSSSAFMNGLKEDPTSPVLSLSNRMSQACSPMQDPGSLPNSPAPIQQLDSFTTVFASPPSTPLAVVSDIHPYDAGSPSSSSSSSSESSPQPSSSSSPPSSLGSDAQEIGQSFDAEFGESSKLRGEVITETKSDSSSNKQASDAMELGEPMDQVEEEDKYEEAQEKLDVEEDLIKLQTSLKSNPREPSVAATTAEVKEIIEDQKGGDPRPPIDSSSPKKGSGVTDNNPCSDQKDNLKSFDKEIESINVAETANLNDFQSNSKVEQVESTKGSTGFIADQTQSAGPSERAEENEELNKSTLDGQNDGNDSIKTDSTDSIENPADDPDPEQDQEPTSSGSSTVSEEETVDSNVLLTNATNNPQQSAPSTTLEEAESH